MNSFNQVKLTPDEIQELDTMPADDVSGVFSFRAICTSEDCCTPKNLGIVKNVRRTVDECPDCGYFLFWERNLA